MVVSDNPPASFLAGGLLCIKLQFNSYGKTLFACVRAD